MHHFNHSLVKSSALAAAIPFITACSPNGLNSNGDALAPTSDVETSNGTSASTRSPAAGGAATSSGKRSNSGGAAVAERTTEAR